MGLGGNVGDVRAAITAAIGAIDAVPGVSVGACSSLWRSAPVDADGDDFLNAVVEVTTTLEPEALLQQLHRIEAEAGRQRPYRHAPRTLDLDLLMVGQRCIDTPSLQLPHPRLHERAFVLLPLLELDPAVVHPRLGPLTAFVSAVADQVVSKLMPLD
ncbi:MAG: 2-amino-4-hydroxy-6-hydroxymethyldihydropteridine diphosphokinase [Rubrivivax sp.]